MFQSQNGCQDVFPNGMTSVTVFVFQKEVSWEHSPWNIHDIHMKTSRKEENWIFHYKEHTFLCHLLDMSSSSCFSIDPSVCCFISHLQVENKPIFGEKTIALNMPFLSTSRDRQTIQETMIMIVSAKEEKFPKDFPNSKSSIRIRYELEQTWQRWKTRKKDQM